jgi:hypothetical protein
VKSNTEISVSCYRFVCCQNNIQRERERERERKRERDRDRETDRQTETERQTDRQKERNRRGDAICFTPTRRLDVGVSSVAVHFLTDLLTSIQALVRLLSTDYFGSIMNQNGSQSPHLSADSR